PNVLPALLARIDDDLGQRGLDNRRLGRVALAAWSAGYGAVARILDSGVLGDSVDAVILLDGFHSSFDQPHHVELTRIASFEAFAQQAMRNERLFTITHSEVETYTYPTSRETSDALLAQLKLERTKAGPAPTWPALAQDHGVHRDKIPPLEP